MPAEVEEQFAQFGPIKPGGVNVRSQKQGVCYAFVEFENSISAQNAIEVLLLTELHSTFVEEFRSVCHRKTVMIGGAISKVSDYFIESDMFVLKTS
jgi:hypothetical protein